jgi:hypothetical protein
MENNRTRSSACSRDDQLKLLAAQNIMASFENHPQVHRSEVPGAPATDDRLQLSADPESYWPLLDERRRFYRMTCDAAEPEPDAVPARDGRSKKDPPRLLLTKSVDGLTLRRRKGNVDDLKKIPAAEISFVDDDIGNTETFRVNATAGLDIAVSEDLRLIPFAQFIRSHVEDTTGAKPVNETSKLALGLFSTWYLTDFDTIEFAALYANDLEDGNEVVSARIGWRPGFLYQLPTFNVTQHFLCPARDRHPDGGCRLGRSYFGVRTDAKLVASAGRVIDAGSDPLLIANRDYARLGGEARLTLFGFRGVVRDLSVDVGYRHLFSLWNDPDNISSFTSGINYWIGGSPHVALRLGYERSRDEETLKRTKQWTASLGVRF